MAAVRLIISEAATDELLPLVIHDMTCAFLHASMDGEPPIFLALPEGMGPAGKKGLLRCALHGTRRASFLWGETFAEVLLTAGAIRVKVCPQVFFHPKWLTRSAKKNSRSRWAPGIFDALKK